MMSHTFECPKCVMVKTELVPYYGSGLMCQDCRRALLPPPTTEQRGLPPPPPPPPMRTPNTSIAPSIGSLLIVLVFIAGVAVGAKMSGGW